MDIMETLHAITGELNETFSRLDPKQLGALQKAIQEARRIFVAGAGRSLLMIRGLAMRLMHIGREAYVVGETVTPSIAPGDLLIIASGSGSTGSLTVMAEKCKTIGARLALFTTVADSPIGRLADLLVEVKAASTKNKDNKTTSIQPGGNTFEQSVLLIGDALIIQLTSLLSVEEINRNLMTRHANLE